MPVQAFSHARDQDRKGRSGWSDEELARAVRAGDGEAFGELYRRYAGTVRGFVAKRVRGWVPYEDLAAEVFTEALARLRAPEGTPGAYREEGAPFRVWLCLSVGHHVLTRRDWTQWEERQAARTVAGDLERELSRTARGEGGASGGGALRGDLADALAALPDPQRRVVELRYLEGQSVETTARVLGISESAVTSRAARALEVLGRPARPARPARDPDQPRVYPTAGPLDRARQWCWKGYVMVTGQDGRRRQQWFTAPSQEEARARWEELRASQPPPPPPLRQAEGLTRGGPAALARITEATGGRAVVDSGEICAALGISRRTAQMTLAALERQGLARALPRRGRAVPARYQLDGTPAAAPPRAAPEPGRVPQPRQAEVRPPQEDSPLVREPARRGREPELALAGIAPPSRGRGGRSR